MLFQEGIGHNIGMTRLLLVIDDYNEMMYLQTLLKKLGFDVDSVTNARQFEDVRLGFNPKFVIMTAHGKKINGIELTKTLVKRDALPRVFLLKSSGQIFNNGELTDPKIDRVLESPVNISNLVKAICNFDSSLKQDVLANKLTNLLSSDNDVEEKQEGIGVKTRGNTNEASEVFHIKGRPAEREDKTAIKSVEKPQSSMSDDQRRDRYNQFLNNLQSPPQGSGGFPKDKIKLYNRNHRVHDRDTHMKKLDEHKKNFVKALYSHLKGTS